jgi:hypothetical protein
MTWAGRSDRVDREPPSGPTLSSRSSPSHRLISKRGIRKVSTNRAHLGITRTGGGVAARHPLVRVSRGCRALKALFRGRLRLRVTPRHHARGKTGLLDQHARDASPRRFDVVPLRDRPSGCRGVAPRSKSMANWRLARNTRRDTDAAGVAHRPDRSSGYPGCIEMSLWARQEGKPRGTPGPPVGIPSRVEGAGAPRATLRGPTPPLTARPRPEGPVPRRRTGSGSGRSSAPGRPGGSSLLRSRGPPHRAGVGEEQPTRPESSWCESSRDNCPDWSRSDATSRPG